MHTDDFDVVLGASRLARRKAVGTESRGSAQCPRGFPRGAALCVSRSPGSTRMYCLKGIAHPSRRSWSSERAPKMQAESPWRSAITVIENSELCVDVFHGFRRRPERMRHEAPVDKCGLVAVAFFIASAGRGIA